MELEKTDYQLKPYEAVDLKLIPTPADATEQRYIWSYSKEGIVKVTSTVSRKGVHEPHVFGHMLSAKKPGTVTVTGIPLDDTAGANKIQFTVTVTGEQQKEDLDYLSMAKEGTKYGVDLLKKAGINAYNDEWNIFTIQRAGGSIGSENADAYMKSAIDAITNNKDLSITDYARVALAVGSIGGDATNVGGKNLVDLITGSSNMGKATSNAPIFGLIAVNSKNYKVKITKIWDRDMLTSQILKFQKSNGSFGLNKDDNVGSVDMTAMALQALSNKYQEGGNKKVNQAVEKALAYLAGEMDDNCTYGDNSPSTAQVLTALTSLGLDPTKTEQFTRGSKNLITSLLEFKNDAGFGISKSDKVSNPFAETQVTYALDSYVRFAEGKNKLYDLTDATAPSDEATGDQGSGEDEGETDEGFFEFILECYNLTYKQVPKDIDYIKNYREKLEKFKENPANDQEELDVASHYLAAAEARVAIYEFVADMGLEGDKKDAADEILKDTYAKINELINKQGGKAKFEDFDKLVDEAKASIEEAVGNSGGDDNHYDEIDFDEIMNFLERSDELLKAKIPDDIAKIKAFRAEYDKYMAMNLDPSYVEEIEGAQYGLLSAEGKVALYNSVDYKGLNEKQKKAVDALLAEAYGKIDDKANNSGLESLKGDIDSIVNEYKEKIKAAVADSGETENPSDVDQQTPVREIVSDKKEVTAKGQFSEGAVLDVEEAPKTDTELGKAIKTELAKGTAYAKAYDVSVKGEHKGKITLSFNVGKGFDGRVANVTHYIGGDAKNVETIKATVKNSMVEVTVDSLSPFVITIAKEEQVTPGNQGNGRENPAGTTSAQQTGNQRNDRQQNNTQVANAAPTTGDSFEAAVLALVVLVALFAMAVILQRKSGDTK